MRTITSNLRNLENDAVRHPRPVIELRPRLSRTAANLVTYDVTRIKALQQAEGRWGGQLDSPGSDYPISAVIVLDNSDLTITEDYRGYRCDLLWGLAEDSSGTPVHRVSSAPYIVVGQRNISTSGIVIVELDLIDLWGYLSLHFSAVSGHAFGRWDKDFNTARFSIKEIMHELFGGRFLDAVVVRRADGTYENHTLSAISRAVDQSAIALAAGALPFNNIGETAQTRIYFGSAVPINLLSIDFDTVDTNISSWLYSTNDHSSNFALTTGDSIELSNKLNSYYFGEQLNEENISYDAVNLSSVSSTFPDRDLYYLQLRLRVTSTREVTATRVFGAVDIGVKLDTGNSKQKEDYQPTYVGAYGESVLVTTQNLLAFTRLRMRIREDGFHLFYVDPDGSPVKTITDLGTNYVLEKIIEVPNHQLVVPTHPADEVPRYYGEARNQDSIDQFGIVIGFTVVPDIIQNSGTTFDPETGYAVWGQSDTSDDGDKLAALILESPEFDSNRAEFTIPILHELEVWDKIEVEDSRSGQNFEGRISHLIKVYTSGLYESRVFLGGADRVIARVPETQPEVLARTFDPETGFDIALPLNVNGSTVASGGRSTSVDDQLPLYTVTADNARETALRFLQNLRKYGIPITIPSAPVIPSGPIVPENPIDRNRRSFVLGEPDDV